MTTDSKSEGGGGGGGGREGTHYVHVKCCLMPTQVAAPHSLHDCSVCSTGNNFGNVEKLYQK